LIAASSGSVAVAPALNHTVILSAIAFKSGITDSAVWNDYYDRDSGMSPAMMMDASSSNRSVTYNLDKAGNRTSIVDTGVTKTYAPNSLNEYTSAEGGTVTNNNEHQIGSYQGVS
jgi:hypothetical protein